MHCTDVLPKYKWLLRIKVQAHVAQLHQQHCCSVFCSMLVAAAHSRRTCTKVMMMNMMMLRLLHCCFPRQLLQLLLLRQADIASTAYTCSTAVTLE